MIPCYVNGTGMFAGGVHGCFKTLVITWLERSELDYAPRYRYYGRKFPELDEEQLARAGVCDPIEL